MITALLLATAFALWHYCESMEAEGPRINADNPSISPDGRWIIYRTQDATWDQNRRQQPQRTGWLQNRFTGKRVMIKPEVFPRAESTHPFYSRQYSWSPGGRLYELEYFNGMHDQWKVSFLSTDGQIEQVISSRGLTGEPTVMDGWVVGWDDALHQDVPPQSLWRIVSERLPRKIFTRDRNHGVLLDSGVSSEGHYVIMVDTVSSKGGAGSPSGSYQEQLLDLRNAALKVLPMKHVLDCGTEVLEEPNGRHIVFAGYLLEDGSWRVYSCRVSDGQVTDITPRMDLGIENLLAVDNGPRVYAGDYGKIWSFGPGIGPTLEFDASKIKYTHTDMSTQGRTHGRSSGLVYASGPDDINYVPPVHRKGCHIYWYDFNTKQLVRIDPPSEKERYEASKAYRATRSWMSHAPYPAPTPSP